MVDPISVTLLETWLFPNSFGEEPKIIA